MSKIFEKLFEIHQNVWIVIIVLVLISIAGGIFLYKRKDLPKTAVNNTRKVVYGGISIALAFILSYIRLYRMPNGGSITPGSMLPIIIYSIIFGPAAGITAGVSYGFLQFLQSGGIVHWAQLILEYPLAFGFLGIAGIIPKTLSTRLRIVFGSLLAVSGRAVMHILAGAIFFAEFAGDANPWIYSTIYNFSYLIPEIIITIVLAIALSYTGVYKSINKEIY